MWFGRRKGEARASNSGAVRLIAETEAFLAGEYADHLHRAGVAVPTWAWLNAFAHGDLHRIRQVRRSCVAHSAALANWQEEAWACADPLEESWHAAMLEERAWRGAQRVLADELLELVDDDLDLLSHVQQIALVPLELELMDTHAHQALNAFELVQTTRAALRSSIS